MARPNLKDPQQRAAYGRELAGVVPRLRLVGILVAAAGALLVLLVRRGLVWLPLWAAAVVLGIGAMLTLTAIATRARYHALRMAEDE
ncbi:MAG: hypothetical protein J7500_01340 [Sphingomonas sp.]|uniref:hypothetical protein n=1 Tax=Sphingomonas sp. TaxID=28214 RepID=UPI001B193CD4|nr:hypothetical protein [Sphingomonas sp.]MBO9621332.1 hypothetical protein [Sphingomonas sp.]